MSHETVKSATPGAPECDSLGRRIYRCGSLIYTKRGLVVLFAWVLWGDFCFNMMETVIPSIMPLKLRSLGSANWVIALIMSTLPGVFNTTICPWVSFKSDHYRSRWGRRIPFIIYTMPFLTASLLLIGFSDSIGLWLHKWMFSGSAVTSSAVIVGLIAVFAAMFDLFNMFVGSVFFYLFNDVVPDEMQSSFMGWIRLVGVVGGALYNWLVFPYAMSHMRIIYVGAALLYFFGFGLMCLKVKEGEYPPPPEHDQGPSLIRDIKGFAKECFTIPFYWLIGVFNVFFQQSMGLDLSLIGKASAASGVVLAIFLTFAGVLADRWHPVRVDAYLNAMGTFFAVGGLMWLLIDPPAPGVYVWVVVGLSITGALLSAVGGTAYMPRMMHLFPKGRFGAFCGAQALVRSAGTMVGGLCAGVFLDLVKRGYPAGSLYPYRFILVWQIFFAMVTFGFCYATYRYWKRMGGETGFAAPMTWVRYADLPKAQTSGITRGMLVPMFIAWAGYVAANAFYTGYFVYLAPNHHSAVVCGVATGVVFLTMPALISFLKFMERP
jgi:MFS family permease